MPKKSLPDIMYPASFMIGISLMVLIYYGSANLPGIDFSIFYAASLFTNSGHPDLAYNIAAHHAMIESIYQTDVPNLPFFYAPYSLFLFMPLSSLSYWWSFSLWQTSQLFLFLLLIYKAFRSTNIVAIALVFPGVLLNIYWGQNALLSTALMLGFIYYIDRNEILAGIFLGILSYKPQFAVMCLIAAIASRKWKCLAGAAFILGGAVLSSLIVWGTSAWTAYFAAISKFADMSILAGWGETSNIQPTLYSFLRLAGVNLNIALFIQQAVSLVLSGIVYLTWKDRVKGDKLSVAIFGFCLLLSLSYYIHYDLLLAIIPLLYYSTSPEIPLSAFKKLLMCTLWILPVLTWPLASVTSIQIAPIVFLTGLSACLRHRLPYRKNSLTYKSRRSLVHLKKQPPEGGLNGQV